MPDKWSNWIANKISKGKNNNEKKQNWENRLIIADKKPYFMQYVYPKERAKLNEYIKKNNEKCIMRFRIPLNELMKKETLSFDEEKFIECYYKRYPLGIAPCTINKICWKIEKTFDGFQLESDEPFDYTILKSNCEYSSQMFNKIKKIYDRYKRETSSYLQYAKSERIKSDERQMQKYIFKDRFKRQCLSECPNEDILCNIVLDLCYQKSKNSKQFAWDICGDTFIKNLLKKKNYIITYPTLDENGDIYFSGRRFAMKSTEIKVILDVEDKDDNCIE